MRCMMAMTMCTDAMLLQFPPFIPRFVMLLQEGRYRGLVGAFGGFRYRRPEDTECSAQRE
ncbi:hypothetical protein AEB_P3423 [Altererythrobacter sp. B11]|nr:hypothetical protein AEB_P3423 [Altererythrobacter sp. B11]